VNMLGIGLHSYGFMDAAFKWLVAFVASQIVIIAVGLLPLNLWRSFRTSGVAPPRDSHSSSDGDSGLPAPARALHLLGR